MKIIISPAKKMREEEAAFRPLLKPKFLAKSRQLLAQLKALSYDELKKLLNCSDAIAGLNYQRYQQMNLEQRGSAALLSYEGIQYQYMAPQVFTNEYFDYVDEHLYILSGFYGLVKPFDEVLPYRLEMQAKLTSDFGKNLYEFWSRHIYDALAGQGEVIINLASKEYSKVITPYLTKAVTMINCKFAEQTGKKLVEKGMYVKMARGEMVRFMAEEKIKKPEGMQYFNRLGFNFSKANSTAQSYVFIKEKR